MRKNHFYYQSLSYAWLRVVYEWLRVVYEWFTSEKQLIASCHVLYSNPQSSVMCRDTWWEGGVLTNGTTIATKNRSQKLRCPTLSQHGRLSTNFLENMEIFGVVTPHPHIPASHSSSLIIRYSIE